MAIQLISFIMSAILAVYVTEASAQEASFDTLLFDNCAEARTVFTQADPEKRKAFIGALTGVIALNTQAPTAPEAFAVIPGSKPGLELNPPAIWQTTDAKRELQAKRCALELLTVAGDLAFSALPQLITIYSEQALSDEIAVGLEETAAHVAELAHKNGLAPLEADMDKIARYLTSERPLAAQNFLQEYLVLSLPRILLSLSNLPQEKHESVVSFLRSADPDGGRSMRGFIDLLPSLSEENASRLASYLPFPTKDAIPPFTSDFARLASDPSRGSPIISLLGKSCVALGGISLESSLALTVARNTNLLVEGTLSSDEQNCLLRSIPALSQQVLTLLSSGQDSDIRRGLSFLPLVTAHIDGEKKAALFVPVKDLVARQKGDLRVDAIGALRFFPEKRGEVDPLLISVLKTALSAKDVKASADSIEAACQSAVATHNAKDLSKFAPLVVELLKRRVGTPATIEIASKIDSLEGALSQMVASQSSEIALQALKGRATLAKTSLPTLVEALRHPQLSNIAEHALLTYGPSSVPLLRKALLRSSSSQRLGILSLLEVFDSANRAERAELVTLLTESEECGSFTIRPKTIETLLRKTDIETQLLHKFKTKAASCVCTFEPIEGAKLLISSPQALLFDIANIDSIIRDGKSCTHLQKPLVEELSNHVLPLELRSHILTLLLDRGQRETQLSVLDSLSKQHALSAQALPGVRILATKTREDKELAYHAVLALARLGDTEFDWREFVKDTIDSSESSPHYALALEVVRTLSPDIVLQEVSPALDSDKPERVAGACRVGATLGQLAIPIVSKVWNLRDRRSPVVKYAAVLALLEINPITPELNESLKALLVNRYYAVALQRPIQWRQCLAVVDLDKSTFGTLRTVHLERLLLK